jgi:Uma2 family endonuclease
VSFQEFLVWPGENQHLEWGNGKVVPMSPVTEPHEDIRGFLYSLLRLFVESRHRGRRDLSQPGTGRFMAQPPVALAAAATVERVERMEAGVSPSLSFDNVKSARKCQTEV